MTDREELIGLLTNAALEGHSIGTKISVAKLADHLVSESVTIRPRAKWVMECENVMCSICHSVAPVYTIRQGFGMTIMRSRRTNFCPHCGAKMIGG